MLASRRDVIAGLKDAAGLGTGPGTGGALRRTLVVAQMALALVLLIGAGLFLRSLGNLRSIPTGFERGGLLMMALDPSLNGYREAQSRAFYDQLLERVRATPGVRAASLARVSMMTGGGRRSTYQVEGYRPRPGEDMNLNENYVSPGYFHTLGMALLAGRDFGPQDTPGAPRVAIVNEALARHFFGDQSPLGRRLREGDVTYEIVGVVPTTKFRNVREDAWKTVYSPLAQDFGARLTLHVRTAGDPAGVAAAVRREVQALDRNLPVFAVRTMSEQIDTLLRPERLLATLCSFFGGLALLLAAVGLYGVMSYAVAGRTREIGVRMALGAPRAGVLWMVLRNTLLLVAIGVAIAIPAALAGAHLVRSLLYGIEGVDAAAALGAATVLAAAALLAGYLPARRASRVDPVIALRQE